MKIELQKDLLDGFSPEQKEQIQLSCLSFVKSTWFNLVFEYAINKHVSDCIAAGIKQKKEWKPTNDSIFDWTEALVGLQLVIADIANSFQEMTKLTAEQNKKK